MKENPIEVDFETPLTPEEAASARKQTEQYHRNSDWLEAHILEIGETCRGKDICIAGQELFVGDTVQEAISQARAAHPEDTGFIIHYIYKEKATRIYALPR